MKQAQRAVRATAARVAEKIGFLDQVPYLLALLHEEQNVAKRVIEQLNETVGSTHHRVTMFFLSANSELRPRVLRVAETGGISGRLLEEVR